MAAALRAEVHRLRHEIRDLEIALLTSNEHGDFLEDYLYRTSTSLAAEGRERQIVEEKLQQVVKAITREKVDLEILVQILIDQGDASAEEGEKARIDSLTQIANRRRFDEYVSQEWSSHCRAEQPLSLMICDVDHFKLFNDHYGHQAGDNCLKAVANVLSNCLRRSGDLVARYGGEEFAMVLPYTNLEGALEIAGQVLEAMTIAAIPHAASPICGKVTLSIGLACKTAPPQACVDADALIAEADRFLYLAKHHGRNRVGHHKLEEFTNINEQPNLR